MAGSEMTAGTAPRFLYRLRVTGAEILPANRFFLEAGRYIVGSSPSCDVYLPGRGVSRRHAALEISADGSVVVEDLQSRNGTFLGERRVERAVVEPPAELSFASTRMELEALDARRFDIAIAGLRRGVAERPAAEASPASTVSEDSAALPGSAWDLWARTGTLAGGASPPAPGTLHPPLLAVYRQARKVAAGEVAVLVRGESGSGKELLARFIHAQSGQRDRPFLAVNCAALPRDLLEAELFGIERGVATGVEARPGILERARGGTVFLDEIGDMSAETQAKVLRVFEDRAVHRVGGQRPIPSDARFVAATNRPLEELIAAGRFRQDLYFRLAGFEVTLPPLRARREDIPLLAAHFFRRELEKSGRSSPGITRAALAALVAWDWPGNVRELENEIAKATLLLDEGEPLDAEHLSSRLLSSGVTGSPSLALDDAIERAERQAFVVALAAAGGDTTKAMGLLELPRTTFYRRLKELGLAPTRGSENPPPPP